MSNLFYCILLAAVNNIDNVGIRIAYGVRGIRISIPYCLWISVMTFFISAAFSAIGGMLGATMSEKIASAASAVILVLSGVIVLLCCAKGKNSDKQAANPTNVLGGFKTADTDDSKDIDFKEATLLGVALSINNAGGCLGGGMARIDIVLLSLLSAVLCFLSLTAGNLLCRFFIRSGLLKYAALISGIVLAAMGILILCDIFLGA